MEKKFKEEILKYENRICCNECRLLIDEAKYWLHILEEGLYEMNVIKERYKNLALNEKLKKTEYDVFLAEEILDEIVQKLKEHFNEK